MDLAQMKQRMLEHPQRLSATEVRDWLGHPVSKVFLTALRQERESVMEAWAAGVFTEQTVDGSAQLNSRALGEVQILHELVEFLTTPFTE